MKSFPWDIMPNFPVQCHPHLVSPCCMGINRLGLLFVQPTGPSLEDTGDHGRTISPPQVNIHLTVYQVSPQKWCMEVLSGRWGTWHQVICHTPSLCHISSAPLISMEMAGDPLRSQVICSTHPVTLFTRALKKDVDGLSVVPGHLLPQAEVLGQQNFSPGSHVLSRSIVEDPHAFHANYVARAPSPAMGSSVSSQAAMRRKPKKAAYYSGKNSWKDYHAQFELVAILNGWNEETKALGLATNLRGSARSILADLDPDQRYHYESLVSALSARFEPDYQADMYLAQIRNRTKQKSESLPELGQAIKRLARYALSSAPSSVRQWLAMTQFTEALNNESLEYAVKHARPKTVDEAVKVAMEAKLLRSFLAKPPETEDPWPR